MNIKLVLFFILLAGLLSSCATHDAWKVYKYSNVTNSKTMIVPIGSDGLKGYLKQALIDDGWKLIVKNTAPYRTKGVVSERVNLRQYQDVNANYALSLAYFDFNTSFELSVYDLGTGEEVLSMSQDGFPAYTWISTDKTWSLLAQEFIEALR